MGECYPARYGRGKNSSDENTVIGVREESEEEFKERLKGFSDEKLIEVGKACLGSVRIQPVMKATCGLKRVAPNS